MKAIIAALFLTALPGCLADVDPSLPQQIEQQADPPPPAPTCPLFCVCAAPSDAGTRMCHGSGAPNLPHCVQIPQAAEDPCNLVWECE